MILGIGAAAVCGGMVANGWGWLALLAVGSAAFLLWVFSRPEQVALALIALVPFSVYPITVHGFSVFAAVPLFGVASLVLLLKRRSGILASIRGRLPIGAFVVMVGFAVVTAALSIYPQTSGTRLVYLVAFAVFAAALATTISSGRLSSDKVARVIAYGAALAGIAVIVQTLAQFAVGPEAVKRWLLSVSHLFGGQRSPVIEANVNWTVAGVNLVRGIFPFMAAPSAGQFMMLGLLAAVWTRRERGLQTAARRGLDRAALVILAVALLLTFSRQAWIGALVGLTALALRRRQLWIFAVILALVAGMSLVQVPGTHESLTDYLLSAGNSSTVSTSQRLARWTEGLHFIPSHWVLGVGPGLYGTLNTTGAAVYYAHNAFLDEFVELGFVGGLAFVGVLVVAMQSALRRSATLGFAMLAAWATANFFDDVLYFPRNGFLLAAAFALAAADDGRVTKRRGAASGGRGGQFSDQVRP